MNSGRLWFAVTISLLALISLGACTEDSGFEPGATSTLAPALPTGLLAQPSATQSLPAAPAQPPTQEPPPWTVVPLPSQTLFVLEVPKQETMTHSTPQPLPQDPGIGKLVAGAMQDLASRLQVPLEAVQFVKFEAVTWPDTSMGCPQPGMEYLQVPQDGALILLQVQGRPYEYHLGGSRGLFLCETIYKDPNPPPKIDITRLPPPTPENSIPPGEDK